MNAGVASVGMNCPVIFGIRRAVRCFGHARLGLVLAVGNCSPTCGEDSGTLCWGRGPARPRGAIAARVCPRPYKNRMKGPTAPLPAGSYGANTPGSARPGLASPPCQCQRGEAYQDKAGFRGTHSRREALTSGVPGEPQVYHAPLRDRMKNPTAPEFGREGSQGTECPATGGIRRGGRARCTALFAFASYLALTVGCAVLPPGFRHCIEDRGYPGRGPCRAGAPGKVAVGTSPGPYRMKGPTAPVTSPKLQASGAPLL